MENINSTTLTILFISFVILSLSIYFVLLKYKSIFRWRINLIVLLTLTLLVVIGPVIADKSGGNLDVVMSVGIISSAPTIAFGLAATKVFFEKNKNSKNIKTSDSRREENDEK